MHKLLCCLRHSASVTYLSMLPSASALVPCILRILRHLTRGCGQNSILPQPLVTLLLSTKGFDNPYNSPQTSKRSCKNTNDNKKNQFDDVVYYPLPVGSCNHFIGDELLYEEVSRPYSHQCISRHPSHILKTFGR